MERPPGLAPGLCLVRIEDDFYLPTSAWVVSAEGLAPSWNRLEGDRLICSSHAEKMELPSGCAPDSSHYECDASLSTLREQQSWSSHQDSHLDFELRTLGSFCWTMRR